MPQLRDVQPSITAGPNAHNQIGPRTTAVCVKLCRLEKSLAAHWRLAIPLTCVLCVFVWLNRYCSARCGQHSSSGVERIAVGRWVWRVLSLFPSLRLVGFSQRNHTQTCILAEGHNLQTQQHARYFLQVSGLTLIFTTVTLACGAMGSG